MKTPRWIVAVAALVLAGLGAQAETLTRNGIKAVVHDSVITYDEVYGAAERAVRLLQWRYPDDSPELQKQIETVLNDNLEQLVQRQLILRDFVQAGQTLPESIVDEAVQERIRSDFGGDGVEFTKTLQAEGLTREKFRRQLHDQIIARYLRFRNIGQEVIVSPHKIEQYYRAHADKYQVEDEVKLRMIVLNKGADAAQTRKLAGEILAKVKEGATFAEMASVYSQDSQSAPGGDRGWVEKSVLKKELADVAFNLKAGESSGVIDLPEACYLLLVEEHRPARTRPLNELREEIERTLLTEEQDRLQDRYIKKLKAKTFIRLF